MKKKTPKKLKADLWELCKKIVRLRYIDEIITCYTCDRRIDDLAQAHTGHFVPSAAGGASLRYDLRNLRVQCYHCNINLGGNGAEFYRRMVEEVGQKEVDSIFRDKQKIVKCDNIWLENKIKEYVQIYESMI